tara:strand:+ start:1577 stop:2113 length:537 start_codon:yes stop_codon:yes gene_type:complete
MPKTDAFFIRGSASASAADQYLEVEIPLGSFVDVMANSVLRILNIEGEWAQGPNSTDTPGGAPTMAQDQAGDAVWQLCTQTQTSLVGLNDKQIIAKGQLWARNPDGSAAAAPTQVYSDSHLPQHYSEGYLVATESIYLGVERSDDWELNDDLTFNMVMECQVEKLDAKKGMALALSQQ